MHSLKDIEAAIQANAANSKAKVTLTLVTPDLAKMLLANNRKNRRLRKTIVEKYARDMRNGKWKTGEDMIVIDKNGDLLNGQHRLEAIIESGTNQYMYIMTDADPDIYEVMDNGFNRKLEDYLTCEHRKEVAAMAGVKHACDTGDGTVGNAISGRIKRNDSGTRAERYEIAIKHEAELISYAVNAKEMSKRTAGLYVNHIAAALLLINTFNQGNKLEEFISDFQNRRNPDPILGMCKDIMMEYAAKRKEIIIPDQRLYNVGMLLTAYELYRSGAQNKTDEELKEAFDNYTKTLQTYNGHLKNYRAIKQGSHPIA